MLADAPQRSWFPPVSPVRIQQAYREAPRFQPGGHRAIVLGAQVGAAVRAPCAGRVTFRGSVGGRAPVVTIDCGALRATVGGLVLGPTGRVDRGAPIGRALADSITLSARRGGEYLDPAELLGVERSVPGIPAIPSMRSGDEPSSRVIEPESWRPALHHESAHGSGRAADRAPVLPQGALVGEGGSEGPDRAASRADLPLGFVGTALALLSGAGLLLRRRRGRPASDAVAAPALPVAGPSAAPRLSRSRQ